MRMTSPQHRARVAFVVALWVVTVVLLVASVVFSPLDGTSGVGRVLASFVFVAVMSALPTVGGVVLVRRPGNNVGRLLVATGPSWAMLLAAGAAAHRLVDTGDRLPGQPVWNWFEGWVGFVSFNALLPMLMLVFPTGRLLSRRWAGAVAVVVTGSVSGAVGSMFAPGGLSDFPQIDNPLGVGGAVGQICLVLRDNVAWLVFALEGALALTSVIVRFRHAAETERAQLKWMVFAASLWSLVFPAWIFAPHTLGQPTTELAVAALPVATGIAVLRYRLYDIDRIISRTITYAALTTTIAAMFVLFVTTLTRLTPVSSQAGVAAATLLSAAAVNPLRRRLQRIVDLRFNRERVDAVRTVERFARSMSNELELEAVAGHLVSTVSGSLQPVSLSLWLAP
jgi:hypothetical protein